MKKVLILIAAVCLLCGCKAEEAVDTAGAVRAEEAPAAAAPAAEAPAADAAAEEATQADTAGGEAAHAEGDGHGHGDAAACTCAAGKGGGTVWCEACSTGYINGGKNADKDAVMAAMAAK